jgi:hypothetical protein
METPMTRYRTAVLGGTAAVALATALSALPVAMATGKVNRCGNIPGAGGVVALKVEAEGVSCKAAAKAIESPKSPAELGYECKTREARAEEYFTCRRLAGGKIRFHERIQRGKA